jgi:hypothetical protein
MMPRKKGIRTIFIVIAVVVVIVIGTLAYVTLSLQTSTPIHGTSSAISSVTSSTSSSSSAESSTTVSSTSSSSYTATAVVDPANSLQLQLSLNASSSATGVAVSVLVDEYNPLATTNNVTAANEWVVALNGDNGAPCGGEENGWPVGFAVASGRYTSSNITDAKLLDLVNPNAFYNCPPYIGAFGDAVAYTFEPLSDTAAGTGCPVNYCPTEAVTTGVESPSL